MVYENDMKSAQQQVVNVELSHFKSVAMFSNLSNSVD